MSDLKPCPFCGGEARLDIGKMVFTDAEVSCEGCGTCGPNCDDGAGQEASTRLAIAAWNTRAETPPADADVGGLIKAARDVLAYRVGDLPTRGYLRDHDKSRAALNALAAALRGLGGEKG